MEENSPSKEELEEKIKHWQSLTSDTDAIFDKEYSFDADDIGSMITYGTNPGMGIGVKEKFPSHKTNPFRNLWHTWALIKEILSMVCLSIMYLLGVVQILESRISSCF